MKFRISKEAFLDGLQKVQHVVSSRTTLPILSNVLLHSGAVPLCIAVNARRTPIAR